MTAPAGRRIRVIQLVRGLDVGGLEFVVLNLARGAAPGFDHRVVCLHTRGELAPRFEEWGVPVESLGAYGRGAAVWRLARRLRELRPDVLHTHNPTPHLVGAVAGRLTRVPVVVHTKHGRNYPDLAWAVRANRLASWLSDAIVAVSDDAARVARDVERVPSSHLRVFHNGVDLGRGPGLATGPRLGASRAVCVARLHPVKDHATLLHASRRVLEKRPDFHLDLVGDGPERPRLELLARELGLGGAVTFCGHHDDIRPFLAVADLFVLASMSEGISLTVLEAMAASLPVVATDVGGNREVVVVGETGWLVPPGSPEALAEALLAAIVDRERSRAFGEAGRRRVEALFDLRVMVTRYEALYLDLLRQKGRLP